MRIASPVWTGGEFIIIPLNLEMLREVEERDNREKVLVGDWIVRV